MRQCIFEFLITKGKIWCGAQFVELIKRFRMAPLSPSGDFSTWSYDRFCPVQNPVYEGILPAQQISSRYLFGKFVKSPENDSDIWVFIFSKYTTRPEPLTDKGVCSHLPYDLHGRKWGEVGQKISFSRIYLKWTAIFEFWSKIQRVYKIPRRLTF